MFKIGQKIVCIKDDSDFPISYIKKGNIYTIVDFVEARNGTSLLLKEAYNGTKYTDESDFYGWNPIRFEPLKYDIIPNSEIIKEMITERSDVPIKEPKRVKEGAKAF